MKKGIRHLVVGLLTVAATVGAYAGDITVTWNAFKFTGVALAGGGITPVPLGNTIQIGYFTIAPTLGSSSLVNFVPWATSTINDTFDGFWTQSNTADEAATATGVNGRQMYIVVTAPGSNLGIFSSTLPAWKFPTSADTIPSTSVDLDDLVTGPGTAGNALAASGVIIFGSGPFYSDEAPAGAGIEDLSYFKLGVIPEPSTYVLVGMGLLGAIGLMRRRRS